jgi:ribonuclease P protein component
LFTFKKIERLSSKKDIALLYNSGKSKNFFPLKIYWRETNFQSPYPMRLLISVPKRQHKKAADRNLIKRRIREAYRLQKQPFYTLLNGSNQQADVMILYSGKEIAKLPELMTLVQKALTHAVDDVRKNPVNNVKEAEG